MANVAGLAWLALIGAALTYILWFRDVTRLCCSDVWSCARH
ncbi:hypothetical protein ACFFJ7_09515 [Pseudochelatococcus lubricantis]